MRHRDRIGVTRCVIYSARHEQVRARLRRGRLRGKHPNSASRLWPARLNSPDKAKIKGLNAAKLLKITGRLKSRGVGKTRDVAIKIENTFVVPAPSEDAWRVLVDVPRVVPCMPGAKLTEVLDERRFRATARLKVGPVDLQFGGEGELYGVDAAARTAKLRAKGRDAKGRGAFQAEMLFRLTPQGAETLVRVDTDLTLSGSVAQYGRGAGIVKEMTGQLTAQFARNLSALITAGEARAKPVEPISGLALLFSALKAIVRRWFGARP